MPKRTDIRKILLIGSGPIVIGQACEFDYSGTQACKALQEEGYEVVLVNSNPATIMTDPDMADRTYIEPITWQVVAKIIEKERPDALLPTLGGQTGLNTAMDLHKHGILQKFQVEMIGARADVIDKAEDRAKFKEAMQKIGIDVPRSGVARSLAEAHAIREFVGLPCVLRPSFTLGGTGGGIAYNKEEFTRLVELGLELSPVGETLIEESVIGWKEYELEVMRDRADNVVIICSIENFDPMGVHTGDSITVAPIQTLSDKEYQRMRDAAKAIIREIGVETGGSNIQFAVHPDTGRMIAIEMNPRVSRSSALASKATGFPIAKIAAKLAVGYTLDELRNDITRETPACFEPTIDYVVTKVPRWTFEKFPEADPTLTTQMKSVGETMAIGRTFKESLQKALRGLETGRFGLGCDRADRWGGPNSPDTDEIVSKLTTPNAERIWYIRYAFKAGFSVEDIHQRTKIDRWFLHQIQDIIRVEDELASKQQLDNVSAELLLKAKQHGFSDKQIAQLTLSTEDAVRKKRLQAGIQPVYKLVDTCAAEFEAYTPYYYSTYETPIRQTDGSFTVENEVRPLSERKRIMILGGGPNRIGQGIEFDYCCVHACYALRDLGFETIMINCNPETVSTDYDTADRLYFEPLTLEHVLNVWESESGIAGEGAQRSSPRCLTPVLVQFGGQTPLNLAQALKDYGVPIWGTSPDAIALAEDRQKFAEVLRELDIPQPENGTAMSLDEARRVAAQIGYPVLVRPSYVLGGRAMGIVYGEEELQEYIEEATRVSPDAPVLIDRYLEDSFELDVDAVADGERVVIGGIMEQIEEAGVHSGDSACMMPPLKVSEYHLNIIRDYTERIGLRLGVKGLMNVQFAIKDEIVYVLEVNPRASRTTPFVSKATGVPLAKIAARIAAGQTLEAIGFLDEPKLDGFFVKEVVLPFNKFPSAFYQLGPEMRSTGEVMGHASTFGHAYAKAELGAGERLPSSGRVLLSVNDNDKPNIIKIARDLHRMGFELLGTRGTAEFLNRFGVPVVAVNKVSEGSPHVVDYIRRGEVHMVISTPLGQRAYTDGQAIRAAAIQHRVLLLTTLSAASAAVQAIRAMRAKDFKVRSLQAHHGITSRP